MVASEAREAELGLLSTTLMVDFWQLMALTFLSLLSPVRSFMLPGQGSHLSSSSFIRSGSSSRMTLPLLLPDFRRVLGSLETILLSKMSGPLFVTLL